MKEGMYLPYEILGMNKSIVLKFNYVLWFIRTQFNIDL